MARIKGAKVKVGFDKPFEFNQRFKDMNKLSSSFNKFASKDTKKQVERAIRLSAGYAAAKLLPANQQQFDKYHVYINRNFPSSKANKSWNVGVASKDALKSIAVGMLDKNLTKVHIADSGGITLSYTLEPETQMKLIPERRTKPRQVWFGSMGGRHRGIASLEEWFRLKNVIFSGIKSKNPYKTQAFMTINSWAKKGKPPIMKDRALRISLNDEASEVYSKKLSEELDKIKGKIANDLITKIFKQ